MTVRRLTHCCLALGLCLAANASAQTGGGEWRAYSGDPGSMKYAPLDQINKTNVKSLRIAWRRPAVDPGLLARDPKLEVPNNFRATPLMVNGVLYSPNGIGLVEAFDASTGKTIWIQEPPPSREGLRGDSTRGVSVLAQRCRRANPGAARRDADGAQREERDGRTRTSASAGSSVSGSDPATRPAIAGPAPRASAGTW